MARRRPKDGITVRDPRTFHQHLFTRGQEAVERFHGVQVHGLWSGVYVDERNGNRGSRTYYVGALHDSPAFPDIVLDGVNDRVCQMDAYMDETKRSKDLQGGGTREGNRSVEYKWARRLVVPLPKEKTFGDEQSKLVEAHDLRPVDWGSFLAGTGDAASLHPIAGKNTEPIEHERVWLTSYGFGERVVPLDIQPTRSVYYLHSGWRRFRSRGGAEFYLLVKVNGSNVSVVRSKRIDKAFPIDEVISDHG